jgi:spore germination protein YaaH
MSSRTGLRSKIVLLALIMFIFTAAGFISSASTGSEKDTRFNMSYVYFGNSSAYTGYVDGTGGSLNDISPSYFNLNGDGTLKLTIAVDRNFIKQMHDRGVKVTPFLSNHWDRQTGVNALANREVLSAQIVSAIKEYDLDGINVDIENVTETERESYTDFMKLLREKLPDGKSLSIAVASNPNGMTTGWYGSYDFAALAQYCDYLMLMAYDESYQGGPAGPVAGYPFVEKSVKAALQQVPANKLVLGVAFYGRLWKQGSNYGGYGISNSEVESLIAKYRGKITYDSAQQSPKATITILSGDVKPQVFGKTLDAGKYDIWYENETSIKSKLALVDKYDLKGTGSWSLGQESQSTWDYYSLWLNGAFFKDAQSSWARQSILDMVKKGWMIGASDTQFMPDSPVTRAQAAVILVRALGIDTSAVQDQAAFTDTANHWARTEIEAARRYGLVQGTGDGKFEPDATLTREQMAVLLDRILKLGTTTDSAFPDVTAADEPWSYEAINSIAAAGILQGYPDGGFHPGDSIVRGQMAALMDRSAHYLASSVIVAMN